MRNNLLRCSGDIGNVGILGLAQRCWDADADRIKLTKPVKIIHHQEFCISDQAFHLVGLDVLNVALSERSRATLSASISIPVTCNPDFRKFNRLGTDRHIPGRSRQPRTLRLTNFTSKCVGPILLYDLRHDTLSMRWSTTYTQQGFALAPATPESAGCPAALIDPAPSSEGVLRKRLDLCTSISHWPHALLRWGKKRGDSLQWGDLVLTAT